MSDAFTASNGKRVATESEEGGFTVGYMPLTGKEVAALREFFQHESDEELGRWRFDRGSRGYVVYPKADGSVRVAEEITGQSEVVTRESAQEDLDFWPNEVADAYFAAHLEPKPWHDAKPGEVWALKYEGVEQAWGVGFDGLPGSQFVFACGDSRISASDVEITAGRRIWPEVKP